MFSKIRKIIASKYFFAFILLLFSVQALWLSFSTIYPSAYDEEFHIGVTEFYTHQYSPVITQQSEDYDYLRDLKNESSHFYHYLMSFPYRILNSFVESTTHIIIILRILNILMVIGGLILYNKLFKNIGINSLYINIGIFLLIMMPLFVQVSSIVNYDNLLFLLTPLYLLLSVKFIKSKNKPLNLLILVVILGMIASLVKYTFLPIFVVSILYIVLTTKQFFKVKYWKSVTKTQILKNKQLFMLLTIVLMIFSFLFSHVYVRNIINYHTPQPACEDSFELDRCLKSEIVYRNQVAEQTVAERPIPSIAEFTDLWYRNMVIGATFSISDNVRSEREVGDPTPPILNLYFFGGLASICIILYGWNFVRKKQEWNFLIICSVALTAVVFLNNYMILRQFHYGYAIQARYLFGAIPIIIVMAVFFFGKTFSGRPIIKLISICSVVFLLSQGGGILTFMLRSDEDWYFQNKAVIEANRQAQKITEDLIFIK